MRGWHYESHRHALAARGFRTSQMDPSVIPSRAGVLGIHKAANVFNDVKDQTIDIVEEALREAASVGMTSESERWAIVDTMVNDEFEKHAYGSKVDSSLKMEFNLAMRGWYGDRRIDWSKEVPESFRVFVDAYRNVLRKDFNDLKIRLVRG